MEFEALIITSLFSIALMYLITLTIFETKKIQSLFIILLIPIFASIQSFIGFLEIPSNIFFYIKDIAFILLSFWFIYIIIKILREDKNEL